MVQRYTEGVSLEDSQEHYKAPSGGLGKAAEPGGVTRRLSRRTTRGFQNETMVPRNRIELLTRGFSVSNEALLLNILDHMSALGRAADELRRSLEGRSDSS